MRRTSFKHEFVEYVPADLADGVLYVSIRYETAVHLCACGCGNKVVTPITPADWQLLFDGDTVSLTPSVGNWGLPCRSHYWIKRDQVRWAGAWSDEHVAMGRERDDQGRADYFGERAEAKAGPVESAGTTPTRRGRLRRWLHL